MDEVQFFQEVLSIVEREFSDVSWTLNVVDGTLADSLGCTYGLRNLWTTFQSNAHEYDSLEALIIDHMRRIIGGMRVDVGLLNREDVVRSLRPMLSIPERTPELDFFDVTVGGLRKCIVLDLPHTMHYVTSGRLEQWGLLPDEAFEIAERNLAVGSTQIEMVTLKTWPGQPLRIGLSDGYDAARITVNEVRKQVAKELGNWFWTAIPARDHLFACTANISRRTH